MLDGAVLLCVCLQSGSGVTVMGAVRRDTGDGYERYLVSDSVLGPNGGGIAMFLTAT